VIRLELEERVRLLENKIQQLENQVEQLKQTKQPPLVAKPEPSLIPTMPEASYAPWEPRVPDPPIDWEHLIARVWLPRIFIFILLLGVLWGFSAAVTAGIITRPVRILLGLIASGAMLGFGERQLKHNRIVLGQVLLGGAISVLMLTLFAAHTLYDYIPAALAFILYLIVIVSFLFLGIRHRSQTITLIAIFGGYLIPFLVPSSISNVWIVSWYEICFSIAILWISLQYHYRISYYLSLGMLHLTLLITLLLNIGLGIRLPFLIAILIQHVILVLLFLRAKQFEVNRAVTVLTSFSITALWFFILYAGPNHDLYQILIGTAAAVYTGLAVWATSANKETKPVLMTVASLSCFLWLLSVLNSQDFSLAILIEGTLAVSLGIWIHSRLQMITGSILYSIGFVLTFIEPITVILSQETLSWIVLMLSVMVLYVAAQRLSESSFVQQNSAYLPWIDSILLLFFLTYLTQAATKSVSIDGQHLILTTVWTLYAIAAMIIGFMLKRRAIRLAGLAFLFITLIKLIFIDLPDVSLTIRAILFIGLGSIGVILSRFFYKK